jgi:hypothetical protein
MMLLEVLVILEVQRCEWYLVGEAARRDPHVVDRPRASAGVCHRRATSNGEPLTCNKILTESGSAGRRLIALALIPALMALVSGAVSLFCQWCRS